MRTTELTLRAAVMILSALLCVGCVTPGESLSGSVASASNWVRGSTAGGTTPGQDGGQDLALTLTPAEQRMRDQSRAFQKTVWEGVLIGASAGALWGVIKGDDAGDVLKKALIGGAVGGLAGAYVAHKQKEYAGKEDQLDSIVADVRESNKQTEELIVSVRQVIAEDKRRLASVQKRQNAGQATQAELESTRRRVSENKAVVVQASKGAREKYSMFDGAEREYRQQNPGTDTARLQSELNAYNRQIETLDGLADTISAA
jgi:uncharacterized membrane protein